MLRMMIIQKKDVPKGPQKPNPKSKTSLRKANQLLKKTLADHNIMSQVHSPVTPVNNLDPKHIAKAGLTLERLGYPSPDRVMLLAEDPALDFHPPGLILPSLLACIAALVESWPVVAQQGLS